MFFFFFKQKTAYEMRISDWSSDVCSSDLARFIEVLTTANEANKAFGDLKYWLADLAVSLLIRAEQEAMAARGRLESRLDVLAPYAPEAVAAIRNDVAALTGQAMEGVDAYTDDRRVVGNSLMAQSRIHIAAVDARLAALVGRLEADLTGRRNEALRTANDAVRNALILAVVAVLVGTVLTVRSEEHTSELQSLMRISY